MRIVDDKNAQYVVLKSLRNHNVFWTQHDRRKDPRLSPNGEVAYRVLAYTLTKEEAIAIWSMYVPQSLLVGKCPLLK